MTTQAFQGDVYLVRKKVFKLFGEAFHVYDAAGTLVLYSKQKAFRLREDIRLYTGEDMQQELLRISTQNVIDFGATYDIIESVSGQKIGSFRRKGLKSILRDEWLIFDAAGNEWGKIQEDNMLLALVRRFLTSLVPQNFTVTLNGQEIGVYRQRFNPIVKKIEIDFARDTQHRFDRRLAVAGAILLSAIEGRQSS